MNKMLLLQMGDTPEGLRKLGNFGNFDQFFLNAADFCDCSVEIINVQSEPLPKDSSNYHGVLVTGSPAMVTDREDWSERVADWLLSAIDKDAAVLGVCYGHQLIAQAFGGLVDWHPKGTELGTHTITLAPDAQKHPLLADLPQTFPANLAHSQTIITPPKNAAVLGASPHDPHQILAYKDQVLTLQFHPEFNAHIMRTYVDFSTAYRKPLDRPVNLGHPILETPETARILQTFVDHICQG